MHVKWLKHGAGDARKATGYVLAERDHQGIERAGVAVLRGDPEQVATVANSLDFARRYSSGVIAWAKDDAPTPEQIQQTLDEFERVTFAGLGADRVAWTAVQHTEADGSIHMHVLVARVDLATGRAFNPAPPGWQKTYDPLRDALNYEMGWARPDDPARARLVQPGYEALAGAAAIKAGLTATGAKEQITVWLSQRIEAGLVSDRAGIVASLAELGEITREGKDYVSVRPEGFSKPIRLKGVIYEQQFNAESSGDFGRKANGRQAASRGPDEARARRARAELQEAIRRRAEYNAERYRIRVARASEQYQEGDREADQAAERITSEREGRSGGAASPDTARMAEAVGAVPEPLAGHLRRELGADAVAVSQHAEQTRDAGSAGAADRAAAPDAGADRSTDMGRGDAPGQQRPIFDTAAGRGAGHWLDVWAGAAAAAGSKAWERLRGAYDRAREAIGRWIAETVRAVRAGHEAAGGAELALATASASLGRAGVELNQGTWQLERQADRACGVLKMQRADELERFKSQINLAEYAEAQGYEIDRRESSRASTVMRRGDDKIVVATDQDGHGIYFSVRDDADHGSIIDFVQKRQGLNLGEVRKELRPWIGDRPEQRRRVQRKPEAERPRKPEPSSADRQQVLAVWMRMQPAKGRHTYLETERKLSPETLADPRFISMVRTDARCNAAFPHYDRAGLAGFELKNVGFTGFSKNGQKAVWYSANLSTARRVVICESAIDAMSHAQLFGGDAAYLSTGGSMSDHQRDLVRSVLARAAERGAEIVIATDADEPGRKLAAEVQALAPSGGVRTCRHEPGGGKDWNDELRERVQAEEVEAEARERSRGHGLSR